VIFHPVRISATETAWIQYQVVALRDWLLAEAASPAA